MLALATMSRAQPGDLLVANFVATLLSDSNNDCGLLLSRFYGLFHRKISNQIRQIARAPPLPT